MKDWLVAFVAAFGLMAMVVLGLRELVPFIWAISR
jgi:hypothetical protein